MNVEDRLLKMGSEIQTTIESKRQFKEDSTFQTSQSNEKMSN